MKIALLQTNIVWENKQANVQQCSNLIAVLPADVRLIVLPEMFATGFSMSPEQLAETEQGETLQWLCSTAAKYNKAIAGSVIIKESGSFFNRLFFVFPDGSYKKYDKRHLFTMGNEHKHYRAGEERLIVEYEGWRICPLVCYDLRFPIWSRNSLRFNDKQISKSTNQQQAYDLLIYVANWPTARIHAWDTLLAARAIENQCYTIGVNRCGTDNANTPHIGHSQTFDFKGELQTRAADNEESIVITELSLTQLNVFREKFPVWRDSDL